ncbi:hypothetical protein ABZ897_35610 [Nonomuraea sp. NPDC046802]|uniref:hypothetical protein n=1 Tax=Nonomuraea sp. NPDC046802 TaxID=3154919 RepID=UPI003407655F
MNCCVSSAGVLASSGRGARQTRGWDREVAFAGAKGMEIKQWIMQKIHPPVDDATDILAHAQVVRTPLPF